MSARNRLRTLAVAAVLALLSACSALQFGYNNADTLLHWRAGRYFGFEGEQKDEFERRVQHFLSWHRRTELALYARIANDLGDRLARGLSQADLVWGYDVFQARLRESLRAGSVEVGDLLDALAPEQLERFRERLAKENKDHAKEYALDKTPEERREIRVKRNIERLEDWFGSLAENQIARVRLYSQRAPLDDELRDRDRRRMQREILAMLQAREARKRLVPWALAWDQNRDPAYERLRNENLQEYFRMVLDLDRTLSAEQRSRAVKRLRGFAADFQALAIRTEPNADAR